MPSPIVVGSAAGGGLSGTYPNPQVDELQGRAIAPIAPADNEVLTWVAANNRWEPKPPQIPTNGQTWGAIYDVNFTTLPNQTIGAAGAYTIDGLTWYAKGDLTGLPFGTSMTTDVVNGLGLRFTSAVGAVRIGTNGDLVYRHLFLPLSELVDYTAGAPLAIRFRFVRDGAAPTAAHGLFVGLTSTTSDGNIITSAQRQYECLSGHNDAGVGVYKHGATAHQSANFTGHASWADHSIGVVRLYGETAGVMADPTVWAGSSVDMSAMLSTPTQAPYNGPTRSNPGIVVIYESNAVTNPMYLTHLRVEQPKVA